MTFFDLVFKRKSGRGGFQARHDYTNGYGVSVIDDGYGSDAGLYEVAVMFQGDLCYDTPITDDVLGHLTSDDVTDIMERVSKLPSPFMLPAPKAMNTGDAA
ncbi:hypothetical protein [Shimia sp.]|uniref:hypothetical protein n=1 Tax=Shimia sp. TaxID=1954381 RepID=UPI003BAA8502